MDLEVADKETLWQRQAQLFCAATRRAETLENSLAFGITGLFTRARQEGLCESLFSEHGCLPDGGGIALFLAIEEIARHEPEFAFALAYSRLCSRVASVLLEDDPGRSAGHHAGFSNSPFDTALIWPGLGLEGPVTRTFAEIDQQEKRLQIEDPLLPRSATEDVFILGWADSGDGRYAPFWIPMAGGKKQEHPVQCLGLNGISFHSLALEITLKYGLFSIPLEDFQPKYRLLQAERIFLYGAVLSGLLQELLNYAIDYSRKRKTFGKPLILHQAVALNLADMKMDIEGARLLLLEMAQSLAKNEVHVEAQCLQEYLSEIALRVSTQALQALGGHGLLYDHPVEKWVRDVQTLRLFLG